MVTTARQRIRTELMSGTSIPALMTLRTATVRRPASLVVYKHVPAAYADAFAAGEQIRVATYATYRAGDGDRSDPLEGRAANYVNRRVINFSADDADAPAHRAALRVMGFSIGEGVSLSNCVFENNLTIVTLAPQYIFCASNAPDFGRMTAHNERIFRIEDIEEFALRLSSARPDILGRIAHGRVVYEERERDPFVQPAAANDPFRKSIRFAVEDEYRVVWEAGPVPEEAILINAPAVALLISEVFAPGVASA